MNVYHDIMHLFQLMSSLHYHVILQHCIKGRGKNALTRWALCFNNFGEHHRVTKGGGRAIRTSTRVHFRASRTSLLPLSRKDNVNCELYICPDFYLYHIQRWNCPKFSLGKKPLILNVYNTEILFSIWHTSEYEMSDDDRDIKKCETFFVPQFEGTCDKAISSALCSSPS